MTNYQRGARFEYRVRDIFRQHGFEAERKAGSSPYDLVVVKGGRVIFVVDAKKTSVSGRDYIYVSRADLEKLAHHAALLNAQPLVAYGFNRANVCVAFPDDLLQQAGRHVRLQKGLDLEQFLQKYTV